MKKIFPLSIALSFSMILPAFAADAVPTQIMRLGFDEQQGTAAIDALSKGNDATLINNATRSTKDLPPTSEWNRSSLVLKDKAYITTPRIGFNAKSFSITAWLKTTDMSNNQVILSNGDSTSRGKNLILRLTKEGSLHFSFKEDRTTTPDGVFTPNTWHHTAFTFDKNTRQRRIYVDGVMEASGTASGVYLTTSVTDIGRWNTQPFGSDYWQGLMDDVTVYDGVLSEGDIKALAMPSEMASSSSSRRSMTKASSSSVVPTPKSYIISRVERLLLRKAQREKNTWEEPVWSSSSSSSSSASSKPMMSSSSKAMQWSSKAMSSKSSVAPTPVPPSDATIYRVTSFQLHLRVDSRATSKSILTLKPGDELMVFGILPNGWARVQTMDGVLGYVHAGFIEQVR